MHKNLRSLRLLNLICIALMLVTLNVQAQIKGVTSIQDNAVSADDMQPLFKAPGDITTYPFVEGFENGLPIDWWQEYVTGTTAWTARTGNAGSMSVGILTAHSGTKNASFYYDNSTNANTTKLITPRLDMTSLSNPVLSFWHGQAAWGGDQDTLRVYYKTSVTGSWILLVEYTNNIPAWKEETFLLPEKSNDYYLAFEGKAKFGYGIVLDDIRIEGGVTTDAGVTAVLSSTLGGSAPATVSAAIRNYGITAVTTMNIAYQLDNNTPVVQAYSRNLQAFARDTFTFNTKVDVSSRGTHSLRVWTELNGDLNHANDTAGIVLTTPFCGGNGTEQNPYQICDTEALAFLADDINAGNGNATAGIYYKLTTDLDLNGWGDTLGWKPIGTYISSINHSKAFQGVFDGNGHVVKNLNINRPSENYVGLFGFTKGGTIKNLAVTGGSVTGRDYVGGLVGYDDSYSTIQNCYATDRVNGQDYVGGLAGDNSYHSSIYCSYATCSVKGRDYAGALEGYNYQSTTQNTVSAGASVQVSAGANNINRMTGYNSGGTYSNNYVLDSMLLKAGDTVVSRTDGGVNGTRKALAQLQSYAFYSNSSNWQDSSWSIADTANSSKVWNIWDGKSYPYFQKQSAPAYNNVLPDAASNIAFELRNAADSVLAYNLRTKTTTVIANVAAGVFRKTVDALKGDTLSLTVYEAAKNASYPVQAVVCKTVGSLLIIGENAEYNDTMHQVDSVYLQLNGTNTGEKSWIRYEYYQNGTLLATLPVNAGVYKVVARFAGNDTIAACESDSATLNITPKAITVTADDKNKTVGSTDPEFTYQITTGSLVGSDSFSGVLTRNAGETIGSYAIKQGTLTLGSNYNLIFVEGMLNITATPINVAKSKEYTIKLYPNPVTNGQLTIDNVERGIGVVEVLDMKGELVRRYDFGAQTQSVLDLQGLHGSFVLRMRNITRTIVVL